METIRIYLDNLFAGLPDDERLVRAKEDLLSTMEDKYNSLKAEGKSENEAIGVVISEFGNIDELLEELEISRSNAEAANECVEDDGALHLTEEEAESYIHRRRSSGWLIGIGVFLCILAPALLISINAVLNSIFDESISSTIGVTALLITIALAVILFIVCASKDEKYEAYEDTLISLPEEYKAKLSARYDKRRARIGLGIGLGIFTILLGVCVMIVGGTLFGGDLAEGLVTASMLTLIGIGVMIICKTAISEDSYKYLLNIDKKVKRNANSINTEKKEPRAVALFSAILWPVVLIAYFIWSFGFSAWGISWILFPIAGILNGCVSNAVRAYKDGE